MRIYLQDCFCMTYKLVLARLARFWRDNGCQIVEQPEQADACVAGVCAAFEADEQRSVDILTRMFQTGRPVWAYGCRVRVRPARLRGAFLVPADRPERMAEALSPNASKPFGQTPLPSEFRCPGDYRQYDPAKRYIAISTGCAYECSYCPHKLGAGQIASADLPEVLAEVAALSANPQVKRLARAGIDTACWGVDCGSSFARLLEDVLAIIRSDMAIHVAQFNPEGLSCDRDRLMRALADPRVTELQLPIQTASQRLLALMNRHYDPSDVAQFIGDLRRANPGIALRTDMMVGFPTETAQELDETIDLAARLYDEVAVYGFELKPDTPIARSGLSFHQAQEVERRRCLAVERLQGAGLLVHSGGQIIETLIATDRAKAQAGQGNLQGTQAR